MAASALRADSTLSPTLSSVILSACKKQDILPSLKYRLQKTTENQKYQYFVSLQVLQKNKIIYPVSKITSSLQKAQSFALSQFLSVCVQKVQSELPAVEILGQNHRLQNK